MAPPPPPPTKEPEKPAPVAAPEPPAKPVFPVLSAFDTEVDVVPFDDGATLVARSLVAVVRGAALTQNPAWLTGLPQSINTEGIRIHTPRFDRAPAEGEPFPVDYRVGTVKIDVSAPQGAFGWKGPAGFGPIAANAKPKPIPGIPQALDGTGEHTFPAPGGGLRTPTATQLVLAGTLPFTNPWSVVPPSPPAMVPDPFASSLPTRTPVSMNCTCEPWRRKTVATCVMGPRL